MDTAAFVKWLSGIEVLDQAQRGRVFQALAHAEATDRRKDHAVQQDAPGDVGAGIPCAPATTPAAGPPGEDLMSKVGRVRIAQFWMPALRRRRYPALGQGWRQASIPLPELPEDLQSADRDAVVWTAPP